MLNSLKTVFSAPAAALAVGTAAVVGPLTGNAQETPVVQASMDSTINWVEDADAEATVWRDGNPGQIAVTIYAVNNPYAINNPKELTPTQLTDIIPNVAASRDFPKENIELFFEPVEGVSNAFGVYYDDIFKGPLNSNELVVELQNAAVYMNTNNEMFQTASNTAEFEPLN